MDNDTLDKLLKGFFGDRKPKPRPGREALDRLPPFEWLKTNYPRYRFAPFAPYHEQFWDEIWKVEKDVKHPGIVLDVFRGGAKSSSMELAVTSLFARSKRLFCVYISRVAPDAYKHTRSIQQMLESEGIQRNYPEIGTPRIGIHGNREGWREGLLTTEGGHMLIGAGLNDHFRGLKDFDQRPDIIVFDDIDKLHDSPEVILKNIETITQTIIPLRGPHCLYLFGQNEIRKHSIMWEVMHGEIGLFGRAVKIGPVKGFEDLTHEPDPTTPGMHILTSGTPNWPGGYTLEMGQADVDEMTLKGFLREVQQEIETTAAGAIYPEWIEDGFYHIITWSEFYRYYGYRAGEPEFPHIPLNWRLSRGLDWGTTPEHPAACHTTARPAEDEDPNFDPLLDSVFVYREQVRPTVEFPEKNALGQVVINPVRFGKLILERESLWGETARIVDAVMSHEQKTVRDTFEEELDPPLFWTAAHAGATGGIDTVKTYLEVIENEPHPFARHPVYPPGHPKRHLSGKPVMGRPRFFVIVDDAEGAIYYNEKTRKAERRPARTERGQIRLRQEFPKYHWVRLNDGTERQVPRKMFDDAMDDIRYQAHHFWPAVVRLTPAQLLQKEMARRHPHLEKRQSGTASPEDEARRLATRAIVEAGLARRLENEGYAEEGPRARVHTSRRRPGFFDTADDFDDEYFR